MSTKGSLLGMNCGKVLLRGLSPPPAPQKWVYDLNPLCRYSAKKTLYTMDCTPEDAELWTPFDHVIYQKTEMDACSRLHLPPTYIWRVKYWNDPDYPVDWTEGEFS